MEESKPAQAKAGQSRSKVKPKPKPKPLCSSRHVLSTKVVLLVITGVIGTARWWGSRRSEAVTLSVLPGTTIRTNNSNIIIIIVGRL